MLSVTHLLVFVLEYEIAFYIFQSHDDYSPKSLSLETAFIFKFYAHAFAHSCLYVCVCTCECVCVCACMCVVYVHSVVQVRMHRVWRLMSVVPVNFSPIHYLRQGLFLNLELTYWLGWLPGSYRCMCLCSFSARIQRHDVVPSFCLGAGDANPDPHTCISSTLPTDPHLNLELVQCFYLINIIYNHSCTLETLKSGLYC